jgi:WD40 repeat protein
MGRDRFWLQSWGLKCLIPIGIFGLAWVSTRESSRDPIQMRWAQGKPGVVMLGFAFSPDGKTIATTDNDGRVALRDTEGGSGIRRFLDVHLDLAWGVAFSPDGRFLAVGGVEPGVVIFDLTSDRVRHLLNTALCNTKALAFSPDGLVLAATTERNGDIILWDLAGDRLLRAFHGHSPGLCLAFSPDGRTLAAGERGKRTVRLWVRETGLSRLLSWELSCPLRGNLGWYRPLVRKRE